MSMSITPKAIQDLLDELEASKQSRLRAWSVLQRLRMVLSEMGSVAIPSPAQKTFDAEGEALEHALRKSFRLRNDAIKSLCSSVRRTSGSDVLFCPTEKLDRNSSRRRGCLRAIR